MADVAGGPRIAADRAQCVREKFGQRGLAVGSRDRKDAAGPEKRGEIEFAEAGRAGRARRREPGVLRRKAGTEDDEAVSLDRGYKIDRDALPALFIEKHR